MSTPAPLPHIRGPEDFAAAFAVPRETLARLETYAVELVRWQKAINLIAPSTLGDLWHRHFADSAQLVDLAPAARSWIDLGSGGGFPGLVVAIMKSTDQAFRMTLVESDTRKAAFLRDVARRTAIPVDILSIRAEDVATRAKTTSYDVVSARALAPLDRLLGLAEPLLGPGSIGIFPKGREAGRELDEARQGWTVDADLQPSRTDSDARIVVVRRLAQRTGGP